MILPSIKLSYRQFLNTEAGASTYRQFKDVLYTDDDSLVQTLNTTVLQSLPVLNRNPLRVCDIGGGDGKRITRILTFLHKKFGLRFTLDFVEQSSYLIHSFNPRGVECFCETQMIETLFEEANLPAGCYDLVFLIHSIFAFETGLAVDKVLSLPKRGGTIVVVSNAQESFLAGLKKILDVGFGDSRFEIADLLEVLHKRRIETAQTTFETRWAISKESLAQRIPNLLEWLSLGRFAEIDKDRAEKVHEYIRKNSVDLRDRVSFCESEVVLVARP
ncbi:MAG TPA: hypothetical protein VE377_15905 [Candidatus Dormibacteraeota bacterium]|nr:hypothetical protein [Candidatus Dormibacteraeota bacterium]